MNTRCTRCGQNTMFQQEDRLDPSEVYWVCTNCYLWTFFLGMEDARVDGVSDTESTESTRSTGPTTTPKDY